MPLKIRFRHTSTVLLLHRGPRGGGVSESVFGSPPLSLYVRVLNSFYTHRKTLRLKTIIGEAAFWVPPRIWAYAAENQPDGCFKDYSAEELAMLIGYLGDAQALLEALLQAGFLERETMQVHDWQDHNAYHSVFADRAKKAAEARWAKIPPTPPKTVPDLKGKEPSIASSINAPLPLLIKEFSDAWDKIADNLKIPKCLIVSDARRRKLEARFRDAFFSANWQPALEKLQSSTFCKGKNERGWVATFDWFIQPDTVPKIMEGKYDDRKGTHQQLNKRNVGVAGAGQDDYAAAAKRKVERQVAEAANRQPPQAQGNGV